MVSKEPDTAVTPGTPLVPWPSLVLEVGISESLLSLGIDARWWYTNSNQQTRLVVLMSANENSREQTSRFGPQSSTQELELPPGASLLTSCIRFRPGEWLDSWAILVAMHISDKPAEVTYDLSIPLHGYTRKSQLKQLRKPLAGWAKKIAKHRQLAEENLGLVPLPNQPLKRIFFPPGN